MNPIFETELIEKTVLPTNNVTDFALGQFASKEDVLQASAAIVQSEWRNLFQSYEQPRWAYLFGEGLIDFALAEDLAGGVWGEVEEEDIDDDFLAS